MKYCDTVTAFVIATGPIAVTLGVLGHALVASPWPRLQRIGKFLEAFGWDLKRLSEAFKKNEMPPKPKDPPDDPPSGDQKPVGLATMALACAALACSPESKPPTIDQLERACPAAFVAMTVDCPALAIVHCPGFESLDECPNELAWQDACDAKLEEALAKCPS